MTLVIPAAKNPYDRKDEQNFRDLFRRNIEGVENKISSLVTSISDREEVWITPQMFGAKGDGVADDTVAIQAAIDATMGLSTTIYFPVGTYLVTAPISIWQTTHLKGDGVTSLIKASGAIASILLLKPTTGTITNNISIDNLKFESTGTTWAIQHLSGNLINTTLTNLWFNCTYCVDVSAYTQACYLFNWLSTGAVEQILKLTGNFNRIESIDKEGTSGSSTEPYISLEGTEGFVVGNSLKKILLEATGSVNKVPLKFENADATTLEDYWMELSATNGYALECINSAVSIAGVLSLSIFSRGKIHAITNSRVSVARFNANSEDLNWQPYFVADTGSQILIDTVVGRRGANPYIISSARNVTAARIINQSLQDTSAPVYNVDIYPDYTSGQNLLINPSFEAGFYGWTINTGSPTLEFVASEFGSGLMLKMSHTVAVNMRQFVTVTPEMLGRPLTLRYCINVTGGAAVVVPIICSDTGAFGASMNRVNADTGRQTVTVTFVPSASGSLTFGISVTSATGAYVVYLDEFCLAPGTSALLNPSKFGSYELNGKTVANAAAVPTTGTWKVGDIAWNTAPAPSGFAGWICTTAGSPGTWKTFGAISA